MSHSCKTASEIADFFVVTTHSVRVWLNQWEEFGEEGLKLKPGRGRKTKLDHHIDQHVKAVKILVKNKPKNLNKDTAKLEKQLGIEDK